MEIRQAYSVEQTVYFESQTDRVLICVEFTAVVVLKYRGHLVPRLSSKVSDARTLILQETRSIHDSMNRPKMNLLLIYTFYFKCLDYQICNCINGFVRVLNGKAEQPA